MATIPSFKQSNLEMLANVLGDTSDGLTGSEIHHYLQIAKMEDVDPSITKRHRLFNAFAAFQNRNNCANNIVNFVREALAPSRYVNNPEGFELRRTAVNHVLAFEGLMITDKGGLAKAEKASKLSDVQIRVENLGNKLRQQKAHQAIFHYCNEELLANNYFHAVFEANKGLFHRIKELSGASIDGNKLIEQVFSSNPILIINNFITQSEKDEHTGFCNMLKGLCGMFRNPEAHEPKVEWEISELDALEILGIISYCHRRLDKSQRIRMI
jgi:uncharacterized protein (TIGR02391 family)